MEGWLYGLFALLGVLVGGLFTYLGLREQLKQQKDVNNIEWRHKVRSEPLLKLRNELAVIATKSDKVVYVSREYQKSIGTPGEEKAKKEQQDVLHDWHIYAGSGILRQIILIQYDKELVKKVNEIVEHYVESYDATTQGEELAVKTWPIVIEVQELINKRLEEL